MYFSFILIFLFLINAVCSRGVFSSGSPSASQFSTESSFNLKTERGISESHQTNQVNE